MPTTFSLRFTPVRRADGYTYDGEPETVTVGRYADVARAWRGRLDPWNRHYYADPRRARTIPGASSADGRRFALHIIGHGTIAIHEVQS